MCLGERSEPARGVERLVTHAVDLDLLQALERCYLDEAPVADGLAGIAVLVDEPLGRPGERVLQYVVRLLRQRADPQLHGSQLVELRHELRGGDTYESGRQPAL